MAMFRIHFTVPTSIAAHCDIEAESLELAEEQAEDKVLAIIESHAKDMVAWDNLDYSEQLKRKRPADPVLWDPTDCEENADIDSIDISEVEEL